MLSIGGPQKDLFVPFQWGLGHPTFELEHVTHVLEVLKHWDNNECICKNPTQLTYIPCNARTCLATRKHVHMLMDFVSDYEAGEYIDVILPL